MQPENKVVIHDRGMFLKDREFGLCEIKSFLILSGAKQAKHSQLKVILAKLVSE